MQALDNSKVLDYSADQNLLAAVVSFAYAAKSKYTSAPSVGFSGGGGSLAAGTAVVKNGKVTGITITTPGSGYTTPPVITLTGGDGTGATATAVIDEEGTVTGAVVTYGGANSQLTLVDETVYPSGDSRKYVNVSVYDKFGGQVDSNIAADNATKVVNLNLNDVDGLDIIVTLTSVEGKVKDGTVKCIGSAKTSGYVVMEH